MLGHPGRLKGAAQVGRKENPHQGISLLPGRAENLFEHIRVDLSRLRQLLAFFQLVIKLRRGHGDAVHKLFLPNADGERNDFHAQLPGLLLG